MVYYSNVVLAPLVAATKGKTEEERKEGAMKELAETMAKAREQAAKEKGDAASGALLPAAASSCLAASCLQTRVRGVIGSADATACRCLPRRRRLQLPLHGGDLRRPRLCPRRVVYVCVGEGTVSLRNAVFAVGSLGRELRCGRTLCMREAARWRQFGKPKLAGLAWVPRGDQLPVPVQPMTQTRSRRWTAPSRMTCRAKRRPRRRRPPATPRCPRTLRRPSPRRSAPRRSAR